MFDSLIKILSICAPLFVMLFLGYHLRRRGSLTDQAHTFITGFVYRYSLPILIFTGVVKQDFNSLLDPAVIVSTLSIPVIVILLGFVLGRFLPPGLRGAVIACCFLANTAYIGFPLATNAFGTAGLEKASVVNAFALPTFVILGVLLVMPREHEDGALWKRIRPALLSPVVLAAVAGLVLSLLIHEVSFGRQIAANDSVRALAELVMTVLDPIGKVGLPMALLAVGASLNLRVAASHSVLAGVCVLMKLVVAPGLTLLICRIFFPAADAVAVGTATLLMGCPLSVAFYILSCEFDAECDFVATVLVASTLGSCVTIPLWLAFLVPA